MLTRNQLRSKFEREIVFAGLIFMIATITEGAEDRHIILKVVGTNNQALADAKVYQHYTIRDGNQMGKEYTSDQNGLISLAEPAIFKNEWQRKGVTLFGLYENNLAGFVNVNAADLGKEIEMKLTPACRIYGQLKSTELTDLGRQVAWTSVYVLREQDQVMLYSGTKRDFEFLLPVGDYSLYAYGERLYGKEEHITVTDGQKELQRIIDLPADRLSHLIGKEAPKLQKIKGWINSKPMKLSNLRGKVVLLDFWGTWCGPCIAAIPKLIDLHEKYHDRGLVIIAVHDDSKDSVKELKKEIEKLSKERWENKKIPFAVALDGGGNSNIEGTQRTARGATTASYGINAFPTMVLIDRQGRIVDQFYPGESNELLEKLLTADVDNKP
jgi:thiol-disulfide isomerase/thioredoxin